MPTVLNNLLLQLQYDPKAPMVFNSCFFLFSFLFFLLFYQLFAKKNKSRTVYLMLFSFYFYYKSSGHYFVILLLSSFIDYHLAKFIDRATTAARRKMLLAVSLFANLGMLAYFKYTNFFIDTINMLSSGSISPMDIFLPVGISFYTFQTLSYTIDIYRKNLKPLESFTDFCFYVSFFPQLVAGPIVRASDFIPQINRQIDVNSEKVGKGIYLIIVGLLKKAVLADYISTNFVDRVFDNPTLYSGVENLFAVYGYALQIYCDFSGYSDMAIGLALLLGYEFNINFNTPYCSRSVTEFWRRWHISLSSWLKDYLYIALGGNRKGKFRQNINLFLTMLLGGLWHGANWKFVLWGGMHGFGLILDKTFASVFKFKSNLLTKTVGVLFTFHFVCFSWIFFRADSFEIGTQVISQILFSFNLSLIFPLISGYKIVMLMIACGYLVHFIPQTFDDKLEKTVIKSPMLAKACYLAVTIYIIAQVKSSDIQPFIYFQF